MKAHPVFWHARLDRLKLRAEQAPPAERARLEGSILMLTRAIETMAKCQEAVEQTDALLGRDTAPFGRVWFSQDRTRR
jgi:hypothetical protein